MELHEIPVTLRKLEPSEGKALKNIVTDQYFKEPIYLGKEELQENYIEVDLSEVPNDEPVEETENEE